MKTYEVLWSSAGNLDKGIVIVKAENLAAAQNKFWNWLQNRPVFEHMWQLSFQFAESREMEVIE